jgi:filamentous hemagglutinin family protein
LVLKTLPLAVALCFSTPLWADTINPGTVAGLPTGGTVAGGTVSHQLTNSQLTLTQTTQRAVIDWQSFNIGAGMTVQFIQPNASAAVLNRVAASANMSEIYGSILANGTVVLQNPNGVFFHQGANINVGSLIVTTGRIDPSLFMAEGPITIDDAISGDITNEGSITAENAGLVALVAPSVRNKGAIVATGGRIALSGADRATVSLNNGLYEFAVPSGAQGTNATVSNLAGARLQGARILLSTGDAANLVSGVINLQGVQQASSAIVVDGNTVVLKSDLDAPSIAGSSNTIQVHDTASIQDAVGISKTGTAGAGATVELQAGTFNEQVTLNKANLTLRGVQDGDGKQLAKLVVPDAAQVNGLTIGASNVTVRGLEIAGPVSSPYYDYYATSRSNISRGIAVGDGITGFTIRDNNIHDVRNGILIHGRNSTGTVSANRIENTKSGISVQYTDASGITIADNREGTVGNEWGLNLHLNGHVDGSGTILSNSTPIAAAPTASWQQSLLSLSTSNNGWSVQDQGYTTANRTHVNVAASGGSNSSQGSRLTPLASLQAGISAVVEGGRVTAMAGEHVLASTLNVNKAVTLAGAGESSTTIDARGITAGSGAYGMSVSADDVTLRDFTFYGPSAYYASAYGIKVSPGGSADARLRNFTIRNVTSRGAGKAELDLNGVDTALIDGVTLDGAPVGNDAGSTGGAGLQLTDSANITVRNTTTRNNNWGGLAIYQANRSYNQQVSGISIEANNSFNEANPVYMQDESTLQDFGSLNIAGFDYAVRNVTASTDSSQYTWLQTTKQKAYDFAVNPSYVNASYNANAAYIQGWNGSSTTQNFEVGVGNLVGGGSRAMSIGTAVNQASSGANINVAAGTYAESVTINKALTMSGAGAGRSIIDPVSGDAVAVSGAIGSNATVLIDGFTFRDAESAGISVAGGTTLGQMTVRNSEFLNNGKYGFFVNGLSTAGVPGLANVSILNSTFFGNGASSSTATSLGQGGINLNYYNGNLTMRGVTITGDGEHMGLQMRGYHNAATNAVYDAGTVVFDDVTFNGSYLRPSGSAGTWNPGGPGYAIHLLEYGSVANVSFNNVKIQPAVGHGMFLEGLSSTLNLGNTTFSAPDRTVVGTGSNPTYSMNIVSGANSQNNVKTNIDATQAVFTGAANGFDIEDRVGHALDVAGLGLATWSAGNLYVTQTSGSVQRAIDAASVGNTVNVAAGTYGGFKVNVAGLTVLGDRGSLTQAGVGSNAPVINSCTAWGGSVCSTVLIDAENVTLSGFDISNTNGAYGVQIGVIGGARANGATLSYNRIHDVHGISSGDGIRAIAVEPADNVTIKYNLIEDISPTNAAAASSGKSVAGIFVRSAGGAFADIAIEDNVLENISISAATGINGAKGIWVGGSAGSASVAGLTIRRNQISGVQSNVGAEGILVNHGKNSTGTTSDLVISANTISDVVGVASSHGIELSGSTPNAKVSQNDVSLATSTAADTADVYIDSNTNANAAAATVAVSGNRLTGTGFGLAVKGGATVNASGNWWGTASESSVLARTDGAVDFSPFLMSGTDTDLSTAGFQGNTSNLAVTALGAQTGSESRIQEGVDLVRTNGTVNVGSGTFVQTSRLKINKAVTLSGDGEAQTLIDTRGVTGNYGMYVTADNVTLGDFTVYGPSNDVGNAYGIKVAPSEATPHDPNARLRNFTIRNVTSRGAGRAELDLNGVDGALIDNVTLNGARVSDGMETKGAGLQLTDSANVTVRNITTLNNNWGGLAVYQANTYYNQQVNNITIEGTNRFIEVNPVYLQDQSASKDFGTLNIAGFDYAVRNATNTSSGQYTWLQATKQKAYDFAVNPAYVNAGYNASAAYIQGWSGSTTTQNFEVGVGNLAGGGTQAMTIATAVAQANSDGASINVSAGTYAESVTVDRLTNLSFDDVTLRSLSLTSAAAGSGIGGKVTATGADGLVADGSLKLLANTTLATEGRKIELRGAVQNSGSTGYNLTLATNAGNGNNRGDVTLHSGGADGNSLGQLSITARNFTLDSTLLAGLYTVAATGNVALSNNTLRATTAGATSTLTAGGNVTGSTISAGAVVLNGDGNVSANVTATGVATVSGRNVSGAISGSSVTATAQQVLDAAVTAGGGATLSGREVRGSVSAATLTARADTTMNLALDVTSANLYAGSRADLSGRAGSAVVEAKQSNFNGSFPAVETKGTGTTFINGVPQRDETKVPASVVIVRPPVIVLPPPPPPPPTPPAPMVPPASVTPQTQPAPAAGAPAPAATGGAGGTSGGTSPAATGGSGNSGGTGSGASSSGGSGSNASGGGSGEAGGGTSGSGSGSGTGSSSSSGGSGSSSGSASGGGAGGRSGGAAVAAGGAPRPVTVTRNAPGKAAGESLDRGQGVEVDLSPSR